MNEELVKVLDSFQYELNDYTGNNKYFIFDNHVALADHLISNGVIVQKHGNWEHWAGHLARCSVCGYEYTDLLECDNYCGNCGARMDGDKYE